MEEYEKIYFDEFQHSIVDLGEKVTITTLSDKYERPIKEISSALKKWTEQQKDKKLRKEFILRGIHKEGFPLITIVPEDKLLKARESMKNAFSILYSAEIFSSCPSLNINKLSALKKKNLLLPESELQRKKVDLKEENSMIKTETSNQSSKKDPIDFFKNNNADKKDNSNQKEEIKNTNISKTIIKTSPKNEKISPEIKHDVKSAVNKKTTPIKGKTSKGSIASFFSAKSTAKTEQKSNRVLDNSLEKQSHDVDKSIVVKSKDNATIKTTNKVKAVDTFQQRSENNHLKDDKLEIDNVSKKRPLEDSESKKQEKNPKKQKKISAGRRRIIVDSSDEENVAEEKKAEPEIEEHMDESKKEEEEEEEDKKESVETKPLTPLTYQDEDGFLVTIKEKKAPTKKMETPTPAKKNLSKLDKVLAKAATKQGSIRNFFVKK